MQKQKIKTVVTAALGFAACILFAGHALANGNATISWIAPVANEDLSTPLDLAGYRIFYGTSAIDCTAWDAASDQSTRQAITLAPSHVDVLEANTIRSASNSNMRGYTFSNTNILTSGQTYYFTVVAYDSSGNYSKCVNDSGSNKTGSKAIYHPGKISNVGVTGPTVALADLSILAGDYGKTSWCRVDGHASDINGDCKIDLSDLSILASSWGQ